MCNSGIITILKIWDWKKWYQVIAVYYLVNKKGKACRLEFFTKVLELSALELRACPLGGTICSATECSVSCKNRKEEISKKWDLKKKKVSFSVSEVTFCLPDIIVWKKKITTVRSFNFCVTVCCILLNNLRSRLLDAPEIDAVLRRLFVLWQTSWHGKAGLFEN